VPNSAAEAKSEAPVSDAPTSDLLVSSSVRLCLSGKLPKEGRFRPMRAGRRKFCVSQQDGHFLVMDGICPHKGLPFGKGSLSHGQVVCPWHGWCFDPQTGQQEQGRACLNTLPAKVENGELFVILA
jgi:nitrite reductase/ring-hydroxylating ferredoxin subunit